MAGNFSSLQGSEAAQWGRNRICLSFHVLPAEMIFLRTFVVCLLCSPTHTARLLAGISLLSLGDRRQAHTKKCFAFLSVRFNLATPPVRHQIGCRLTAPAAIRFFLWILFYSAFPAIGRTQTQTNIHGAHSYEEAISSQHHSLGSRTGAAALFLKST